MSFQKRRFELSWYEDKGFREYAKKQYVEAIKLAREVGREWQKVDFPVGVEHEVALIIAVLEKIASPLVYLRQDYDRLSLELKQKYDPSLDVEKARELSARAAAMLETKPR
jgi:hypothetical protein